MPYKDQNELIDLICDYCKKPRTVKKDVYYRIRSGKRKNWCRSCKSKDTSNRLEVKEKIRIANTRHGETDTVLHQRWNSMKDRCYYPRRKDRHIYIDRGITVCDEWRYSYEAFRDWALANGFHASLSLDRIDNDKGYEPSNCRWADAKTQRNNQRIRPRKLYLKDIEYQMILCLAANKFEYEAIAKIFKIKKMDIVYLLDLNRKNKNG